MARKKQTILQKGYYVNALSNNNKVSGIITFINTHDNSIMVKDANNNYHSVAPNDIKEYDKKS